MGNRPSFQNTVTHSQILDRLSFDGKPNQELVQDHSLDPEKVKHWLESYEPQERKFASYIIKYSRHIGWMEFRNRLITVNTQLLGTFRGRFYLYMPTTNRENSIFYFASLVYEHVIYPNPRLRKNCVTVNETTIGQILPTVSVFRLLYCDDMSYSGSQLSGEIDCISEYQSPETYPFVSDTRTSIHDIPFFTAPRMEPFFIFSPPTTVPRRDFPLQSRNEAILLFQTFAVHTEYSQEQWIVLHLGSVSSEFLKVVVLKSWYALKEFLVTNRNLRFITLPSLLTTTASITLRYITPDIYRMRPIDIYLGIPFATKTSLDVIEKSQRPGINIHWEGYEIISTIGDVYETKAKLSSFGKQRFLIFLILHFNYFYHIPLHLLTEEYLDPDRNIFKLALLWFDHKMADPVSTISVILGCGLVVPYRFRNGALEFLGEAHMLGSLLKNCGDCSQSILEKRYNFLKKFYSSQQQSYSVYTPLDRYACGNCPFPFYKKF